MDESKLVQLVNIRKSFNQVVALESVSLDVAHNEVVGLVGDNGAGKSTLIKILSGVFPPDEGEILWQGKKVAFASPHEAILAGIETIYQETAVVDSMTVMRNIFMGREMVRRIGPMRWLDLKSMARESVKALEMVELRLRSATAVVGELSGGQRQGVAIARAMHFKTRLLILDEPTNNLSVKESKRILDFIVDLKKQGISSIFITHNLHHVYPIADRIVVLSRGVQVGVFRKDQTSVEDLEDLITLK